MRIFIAVLVLIFGVQSWTNADDISDFEIEGFSIGDSLLDHFTKDNIDKKSSALYPNKDMLAATFRTNSFEIFEEIQFHWLANDKNYIIQSISANIDFPNDITSCLEKRKILIMMLNYYLTMLKRRTGVKEF